jgi:hypothetical protein
MRDDATSAADLFTSSRNARPGSRFACDGRDARVGIRRP